MMFRFIQPASRPLLSPADGSTPPPQPQAVARRQLDRDYRRWTRLLVGAVGLTLAVFGTFVGFGMPFSGVALTPVDVAIGIVGSLTGVAGVWIIVRPHLSGRALLKALAWWTAEPYRTGAARASAAGWFAARTVNFEPPIFARIVTSSILGLFGIFAVSTLALPTPPGAANLAPAGVSIGVILLATSAGQMGGVMHLVSGRAVADPVWMRIRGAFKRD